MKNTMLKEYGISNSQETEALNFPELFVARVITQDRSLYRVVTEQEIFSAEISGKLRHELVNMSDFPAVGDFVMLDRQTGKNGNGIIHHILTRSSLFVRRAAGNTSNDQAVAANVDTIMLCMSLNNDFNVRKLERYLSLAWSSGATPVVVLTKSDICEDIQRKISAVQAVAIGVDILITSSMEQDGYQEVFSYCSPGKTVALIGSSGVGKSTLINRLVGRETLTTKEIRQDGKGRHTTTRRELILLDNGGIVIDTPGMREFGMLDSTQGVDKSFADVEQYLNNCRFRNCTHSSEPGCAVYAAIERGELSRVRWAAYRKLQAEATFMDDKQQYLKEKKQKLKEISKKIKNEYKK